jgi:Replication initiation factor
MWKLLLGDDSYRVQMYTAGVDYVRTTMAPGAVGGDGHAIYRKAAKAIVAAADGGSIDFEPWAWLGYYGERCASVAYGSGTQGHILQVSGWQAEDAVRYQVPWDGIPRLDVQVTVWLSEDRPGLAEDIAQRSENERGSRNGGRWKVRLQKGYGDGDTCYIGTRGGDSYIRIYDKWRERGGDDDYRHAWRFEVELGGDAAKAVWPDTGAAAPGHQYWYGIVRSWCRRRGIYLPVPEIGAKVSSPIYKKASTTTDTRLAWLRNQVAPSLEKLLAAGVSRETVMEALGLEGKK